MKSSRMKGTKTKIIFYLERPLGSFSCRFRLPKNVEIDEVKTMIEKVC